MCHNIGLAGMALCSLCTQWHTSGILAQLGERSTEDAKVHGSMHAIVINGT